MIRDKVLAARISALMLETGHKLDESVAWAQDSCSADELQAYRRAIGKVMGALLLDVMNPLYAAHPDLKPPELR